MSSPAVELGRLLRVRWRRVATVALIPVFAVAGSLLSTGTAPVRYEAAVTVVVPALGPDVVGSLPATESFRALTASGVVLRRASEAAGGPAPAALRGRVRAVQQGRGNLVDVRFVDEDRGIAVAVVRATVDAAFERLFRLEREASRRTAALAAQRADGPEGPRLLAEALAAQDRVTARMEAAAAQGDAPRVEPVRRSSEALSRAAAISLLLAGISLGVWERARPAGRHAPVGPNGRDHDPREGGPAPGKVRVGA